MNPTQAAPARDRRGFYSSGNSPTETLNVHLLGVGHVGRALLTQLPQDRFRLVAATDRTGTVYDKGGLVPDAILDRKQRGLPLDGAKNVPLDIAIDAVAADVVVDCLPSDHRTAAVAAARARRILDAGAALALASKDALGHAAHGLLENPSLGANAALGGTGATLQRELSELRSKTRSITIAANASTTFVIEAIERGADREVAIEDLQRRGVLEPDPELDLGGIDAALKLCIVVGALWRQPFDVGAIPKEHLRDLDGEVLRQRVSRGATTRLLAHADLDGNIQVAYRELPRTSPLAAPPTQVVYTYGLDTCERRVHVGDGVGPEPTARALVTDLARLAAERR